MKPASTPTVTGAFASVSSARCGSSASTRRRASTGCPTADLSTASTRSDRGRSQGAGGYRRARQTSLFRSGRQGQGRTDGVTAPSVRHRGVLRRGRALAFPFFCCEGASVTSIQSVEQDLARLVDEARAAIAGVPDVAAWRDCASTISARKGAERAAEAARRASCRRASTGGKWVNDAKEAVQQALLARRAALENVRVMCS